MFSAEFSYVLAAILFVLAIVFFFGKGKKVLELFEGKNAPVQKDRAPEQEMRYQRAIGLFCLILAINEILLATIGQVYPVYNIIAIVIVVAALVLVAVYLKKNF